jgi:AsmA protein
VNNGKLTISRAGVAQSARVYNKVDITVTNFSFTGSFPFQLTADLPAGGTLKLDGQAGPINSGNAELTPLEAKVNIKQMNLAQSGFIDPAAGISGVADFEGTVKSDGRQANTDGSLHVVNVVVVKKGTPAGRPVDVKYAATADLPRQSGTLTQGEVTMGKAVAHLSGTYQTRGPATDVNLKLVGQGMPVDDLEAMLPALAVVLPPKSQLKGGTLDVNLNSVGPVDKLVTTGNIKLQNSALAGFDLASKLSAIPALSGKAPGGNNTVIQNFSSDVRMAPEGTQANNINLTVPQLGVLTGSGTVSPNNDLNFHMLANLSGTALTNVSQTVGLGGGKGASIPFFIQGTTSDPKFVPDVKGMAGGFLKNALGGNSNQPNNNNPVNGVLGLFKKKPH